MKKDRFKEIETMEVEKTLDSDGILTLTLNRPEKLNALSEGVFNALNDALEEAQKGNDIRGILLTGSGKAFSAGADISRLLSCNAISGYDFSVEGQTLFRKFETIGIPSLSAINGVALGGGLELAMSTTLRIASHEARFGQPEIKLGIIPGYGGTQRLSRLIGRGRALEMCLTGRMINADTALSYGLVTELVSSEDLLKRGRDILLSIINLAPIAVKSIIEVIDRGTNMSTEDAMHLEALHFSTVCSTEDKKEGVSAFLEKRTPVFQGK